MNFSAKEVVNCLNTAREYPKFYAKVIHQQLASFVDDHSMKIDDHLLYETVQGKSVWEEALIFLNLQEGVKCVELHQGLCRAASDHAHDLSKSQTIGHQGSDGSTFIDRVQRYSKKGKGSLIEIMGATHKIPGKNNIEMALANLIIDDGVQNRGHRKAIFNPDYRYVGVSFIEKQDKIISVILMSQSNLEILKTEPQCIATSTTHLKTFTQIQHQSFQKETVASKTNPKQNSIDSNARKSLLLQTPSKQTNAKVRTSKIQKIQKAENHGENDAIWTFKNVTSQSQVTPNVNQTSFTKLNQSEHQNNPLEFVGSPSISVKGGESRVSKYSNKEEINTPKSKQSLISSTSSLASQQLAKQNKGGVLIHSDGFCHQSTPNMLKVKEKDRFSFNPSINHDRNSVKSSLMMTSSKVDGKKVVEKIQTTKSWNQDGYLVRQVKTEVKYMDGTSQDFIQKHSILSDYSNSVIKE